MHRMARGAFLALALAGAVLAGCGGGGSSETNAGGGAPVEGKQGGKLTMLWTDDVDNIDPGITYYQMGYMVAYATQRPLYSYRPDDGEAPVPDLAASDPQISDDGKTVTVKLRDGVRFLPGKEAQPGVNSLFKGQPGPAGGQRDQQQAEWVGVSPGVIAVAHQRRQTQIIDRAQQQKGASGR